MSHFMLFLLCALIHLEHQLQLLRIVAQVEDA